MKSSGFIRFSGFRFGVCRSVLRRMMAKAMMNTESVEFSLLKTKVQVSCNREEVLRTNWARAQLAARHDN